MMLRMPIRNNQRKPSQRKPSQRKPSQFSIYRTQPEPSIRLKALQDTIAALIRVKAMQDTIAALPEPIRVKAIQDTIAALPEPFRVKTMQDTIDAFVFHKQQSIERKNKDREHKFKEHQKAMERSGRTDMLSEKELNIKYKFTTKHTKCQQKKIQKVGKVLSKRLLLALKLGNMDNVRRIETGCKQMDKDVKAMQNNDRLQKQKKHRLEKNARLQKQKTHRLIKAFNAAIRRDDMDELSRLQKKHKKQISKRLEKEQKIKRLEKELKEWDDEFGELAHSCMY